MPLHIKRLLITFAVVIGLFLIARQLLIPPTFGEAGHYRYAAIAENEAHPMKFMGMKSCAKCHDSIVDLKSTGLHDLLNCEICHGPGYKHNISKDSSDIAIHTNIRQFCGNCHAKNPARSSDWVAQVDITDHHIGKKCTKCHNPHEPWLDQ